MESVSLIENGELVAVNTEFVYDKKKRITQYTYTFYLPDVPNGISTEVHVEYDRKGRIDLLSGMSLTYDNRNNIMTWSEPTATYHYTYDQKTNPLNSVDNLFVLLVEEPFFWDFILSKQNSALEFYPDGFTATYQNQYDSYQRLIRKTGTERGSCR